MREGCLPHFFNKYYMKKIVTTIFVLFTMCTFSQVSFFVGPQISVKGNYGDYKNSTLNEYRNDYFSYESRNFLVGSFGYGLHAGVGFRDRLFLDLSWSKDETRSGNSIQHTTYQDILGKKSFTPSNNEMYFGIELNRFHLSAQYNLLNRKRFENRKFVIIPSLIVGMGFNVSTYKAPTLGVVKTGNYANIDEVTLLTYEVSLIANNRMNFNAKLGIGADIVVRNNYLFTLSVYSTINMTKNWKSNLSILSTTVTLETAIDKRYYYFNESSKGTGLYFEISRRFQLYPWLPISKNKRGNNKI